MNRPRRTKTRRCQVCDIIPHSSPSKEKAIELNSYFTDMLSEVRPTKAQRRQMQKAHQRLRERLLSDDCLKPWIVSVFLQGSYRRSTGIRPQGEDKPDVDVVVVTRFRREAYPVPEHVMDEFGPFLDKHYKGKWKKKGRSIGIELSKLKLDMVVASAPSEEEVLASDFVQGYFTPDDLPVEHGQYPDELLTFLNAQREAPQWQLEPLYIPDREVQQWQRTHPLEQIRWTTEKNGLTNGHYVNIVRLVKWWWRTQHPSLEHPKGYPLEHMVGDCCPDGSRSVAVGLTETLEEMTARYQWDAAAGTVPCLPDRGVPEHNVLKRLSPQEFSAFHERVQEAAAIARSALDDEDLCESAALWRQLLGPKFPPPASCCCSDEEGHAAEGGFTPRAKPTQIGGGRFA